MNKAVIIICGILLLTGCNSKRNQIKRNAVAEVGSTILYYDEMPKLIQRGVNEADSVALIQNYINKWAKDNFCYKKPKTICLQH